MGETIKDTLERKEIEIQVLKERIAKLETENSIYFQERNEAWKRVGQLEEALREAFTYITNRAIERGSIGFKTEAMLEKIEALLSNEKK